MAGDVKVAIVKASEPGDNWTAEAHVPQPSVKQQVKYLRRAYDEWWRDLKRLNKRENKGKPVSSTEWERSDDRIREIGEAAMSILSDKNVVVKERRPKKPDHWPNLRALVLGGAAVSHVVHAAGDEPVVTLCGVKLSLGPVPTKDAVTCAGCIEIRHGSVDGKVE